MKSLTHVVLAAALLAFGVLAQASTLDSDLADVQAAWAHANYETAAGTPQVAAFEALSKRADAFVKAYPGRAEPLIWQGIVLSTYAGAKGGLGALGLAKKARSSLESALAIDPKALDGSAYTSLGTLYYKVPGFPLGFGNKDKAQEFLRKALSLNPDGIDPNYFYADYLYEQGRYAEAMQYLEHAAKAPARAGRERADEGRRSEIAALTARVKAKMS